MIPPISQLTADGYDLQFGTNVLGTSFWSYMTKIVAYSLILDFSINNNKATSTLPNFFFLCLHQLRSHLPRDPSGSSQHPLRDTSSGDLIYVMILYETVPNARN